MSEITLDEAIRKFKDYCQGNGDFDELDFKGYIIDIYSKQQEIKAKLETYKKVAELHCGIHTKTIKRANLKDWLVYEIAELNKQLG